MFLGEAPGFSEDATGKPFVGPAGDELTELIDLVSSDVGPFTWVKTNPVACIPIDERDPEKTRKPSAIEIAECMIRVVELVRILRPKLIVLCGAVAESAWKSIGSAKWNRHYGKGPWDDVTGLRTAKITHPSYIAFRAEDPVYEQKKARLTLRSAIMSMRAH